MQEITSEFTGKKYKIRDISPLIVGMASEDASKAEQTDQLKIEITQLADQVDFDTKQLTRSDLAPDLRKELDKRVLDNSKALNDKTRQYQRLSAPTPESIAKTLRFFVEGLEEKSNFDIYGLGKDLDLLYAAIQVESNKDVDKYKQVIDFFRPKQDATAKPSSTG